ncbi:fimbria/pilus outer membrane usher protein [Planktothricoides raciborskii]|uniref:Fimbria/pilus outer membrane usher protein n=2 Tax=Planktothricoides raciborskii TaxID=132608 RepID=A0AAU8JM28_9CYAN|nr:fimbria/pilus outer membrane usher protein [Planktothricoides raciborskii]MBD2547018.1 fimbrial biogenesis outer membrane usher protein [Planktothricoides raciborskii FACHB-1370]MBD2581334.1 fimbrial biogenesis outer membrane usher protein [Planktothricoides raciborskii FACHB-1261]
MRLKLKANRLPLLLLWGFSSILFKSSPILGQDVPSSSPNVPPDTQNQEPTFEGIFGKPRDQTEKVIAPFFVDGQQRGQVLLILGNIPAVRIQAAPLLTETGKVVREDTQAKLTDAVDAEGNISLEVLQQNGLQATFDYAKLELQIQVPPAQRLTNIANLNERRLPPGAENALTPSTLSGYLNFRGDQDYIWSGSGDIGRQPLRFSVDGALNYKNWVFEGRSDFSEGRNPNFLRGDLRVVRDTPEQALRYVIGDLSIPVTGYQNSQAQVGISIARNFGLQPYVITRPISKYEFFLETDSRVDVLVNGQLERTLQLPGGRHDIRDLPLNAGTNDVELVITDNVGRVQRLNFSNPVAADLLAPGLQQFAYSLGFLSSDSSGDRTYDFTQPILTLSHRLGITNSLTSGIYLQASFAQQLMGWESILATAYGNFGWEIALNSDRELGIDYAARLRYEYLQTGANNPSQRSFRLSIESRGSDFTRVGEENPRNDFYYDINANYSQKLFWNMRGNLSARYQLGRDVLNSYRLGMGFSRSFRNGLNISLNLSQTLDKMGSDEQRAYVNLSWLSPQGRQFIQASTDINNRREPSHRLNWNYNPLRTIGTPRSSLGLAQNDSGYNLTGRLSYTGYRFNWDLSNDSVFAGDGNYTIANKTQVSFGTALVFADGHWGWSRPISNSFALVIPNESLRDQEIGINPSVSGYTTRIDDLGPGVVSNLDPYRISSLTIDAPNLPIGMDVGNRVIMLLPTYRSGTLVRLGTDATVFLRGVLLNANGEPVSLQSAQIVSLSDGNWQPVTLFTNRAGRFATIGLKPGRYEIRLLTNPPSTVQFEIPPDTKGIYDIGTLQPP